MGRYRGGGGGEEEVGRYRGGSDDVLGNKRIKGRSGYFDELGRMIATEITGRVGQGRK